VPVRICIIGKYPPIQGGVSMRNYWSAQALAAAGHDVQVVTNAKETRPPFRMHMRPEDWERCEASYQPGAVKVHWTDPVDRSQSYIPMASAFVSKLAGIAAGLHAERPFDLILSFYLEPYGVAGHLVSQMTGVPHIVRMAGSDAGRLWHHPQLEPLYDHVLRSAEIVIAAGTVAERAIARGVEPDRIAFGGGFVIPDDLFAPDGAGIDFAALRAEIEPQPDLRDLWWGEFAPDRPYFGVCGKLGESKGSFALLEALHRLKRDGLDVGLVALAHGQPAVEKRFRSRATKLGLADRILQIPFLPHWRVPDFLRGCLAVCCLEQDFLIDFHSPIIPREVLLCGTCLVASTEVLRKLPAYAKLPDRYGCVAIPDVNDIGALSERLAAIVRDPKPAAAVGARGRVFARELQQDISFAKTLADICEAAVTGRRSALTTQTSGQPSGENSQSGRFALTQLAAARLGSVEGVPPFDGARARDVLAALEQRAMTGDATLASMIAAVEVEIAVAGAESEGETGEACDPLFRLSIARWALAEGDLAGLVPVRDRRIRLLEFDYDVTQFMAVRTAADFPAVLARRRSYLVAFRAADGDQRGPLVVDEISARILALSDGTRTVSDVLRDLDISAENQIKSGNIKWIERLLVNGLLSLRDDPAVARPAPPRRRRPTGRRVSTAAVP
jgi:glycosyltransferase involved in cell wall biosynthesis